MPSYNKIYAPVAELADAMDLGSISNRSAGSSPVRCIPILIPLPCFCGAVAFFLLLTAKIFFHLTILRFSGIITIYL